MGAVYSPTKHEKVFRRETRTGDVAPLSVAPHYARTIRLRVHSAALSHLRFSVQASNGTKPCEDLST